MSKLIIVPRVYSDRGPRRQLVNAVWVSVYLGFISDQSNATTMTVTGGHYLDRGAKVHYLLVCGSNAQGLQCEVF